METFLQRFAGVHERHPKPIVVFAILFTLFCLAGMRYMQMETDQEKMMPDIEEIRAMKNVRYEFGGVDRTYLVVEAPDVRDPKVIETMLLIERKCLQEEGITSAQSIADKVWEEYKSVPSSKDKIDKLVSQSPLINDDYTLTYITLSGDIKNDEKEIKRLVESLQRIVETTPMPYDMKVGITGTAPIRYEIHGFMQKDMSKTTYYAFFGVLVVVMLTFFSLTRGLLTLTPVLLGTFWTMGTVGWMKIKLSMVTIGVWSMLIGLGVDFGIHVIHRYRKERETKSIEEALERVLFGTGRGIFFTALMTISGFLSLLAGELPTMHQMGYLIALGIFYCMVAALGVLPSILILEERLVAKIKLRMT